MPGLDDPVFDVAITPNRADCMGVRGIARDLAAAGMGTFKPLHVPDIEGAFAARSRSAPTIRKAARRSSAARSAV
jgi:phenylalanyl-tRNA synthetase beta subunit